MGVQMVISCHWGPGKKTPCSPGPSPIRYEAKAVCHWSEKKSVLNHKPLPVEGNTRQRLAAAKELWECCRWDVGTHSLPRTGASADSRATLGAHAVNRAVSSSTELLWAKAQPGGERLRSAGPARVGAGTLKKPSTSQAPRQAQQRVSGLWVFRTPPFHPVSEVSTPQNNTRWPDIEHMTPETKQMRLTYSQLRGKDTMEGHNSSCTWEQWASKSCGSEVLCPKRVSVPWFLTKVLMGGCHWLVWITSGWWGRETQQVANWVRCWGN